MTERRQFSGQRTRAEATKFIGLPRELTVDVQTGTLRVHDGVTPGGNELAKATLDNVEDQSVLNKAVTKEDKSNKVTVLGPASSDTQYPSARCVYSLIADLQKRCDDLEKNKANINMDNLTENGLKKVSANPDWANNKTIYSGYVAEKNGMFIASAEIRGEIGSVTINGVNVVFVESYGSPSEYSVTGSWRVSKGDKIEFRGLDKYLFVPDKE